MKTPFFKLLKAAYATLLRPLVAEKVQSTESQFDDFLLGVLDKLFDYDGNSE